MEIIERFSKDGDYTVRSVYRLYEDIIVDIKEWNVEGECKKIWDMKVLPKVKNLMWCLRRNCLRPKSRLQKG